MLQIPPETKLLVALEPVDFRKGIDGLAATCREKIKKNPMNGGIFVFRNNSKTSIKILFYDGEGFWLCMKRLSRGKFKCWPKAKNCNSIHNQMILENLKTLICKNNYTKI